MYLRWVGGKGMIAQELISRFPKVSTTRYLEPFFGSGAMYFSWYNALSENNIFYELPSQFTFSDTNKFLVNCHIQVRDSIEELIHKVREFETEYKESFQKAFPFYNKIRETVTDENELTKDPILSAAKFIFINKTCFNGLWRVNKKGKFNVPYGKRFRNASFDYEAMRRASKMLENVAIYEREFDNIDDNELDKNTFVYLDPPYVPLNNTSSFTSYTAKGFTMTEDLTRIVNFCKRLDSVGAKWMMSNSDSSQVKAAFYEWNIGTINVHRFIKPLKNKEQTREKVKEVVITNY